MPSRLSQLLWTSSIILIYVPLLSLQTFLLDGNSLDELPSELGSLQRLGYVGLSFNQFNHVPQVLEQLASMEKLCMAGNSLETLTLQNFRLLRVKHIDLRYGSDPILLNIKTSSGWKNMIEFFSLLSFDKLIKDKHLCKICGDACPSKCNRWHVLSN